MNCVNYTDHSVNPVRGISSCLFWELYKTHEYAMCWVS